MGERQTLPIPFGGGLDRETGQMAVRPTSMEDLRNVILHKGKAVAREGAKTTLQFNDTNGDACTHILAGQTILGARTAAIVAYQGEDKGTAGSVPGEVSIHLMDAAATVQRLLGEWFTVDDYANEDPPIVVTAESYGKVFFAHDEYSFTKRADTFVFDPFSGTELRPLRVQPGWPLYPTDDEGEPLEDPDEDDIPTIKFRGVTSHLDYLWGWGFGTNEEDRAEIVRVSLAGEPTVFEVNHYFQVGARNDPTISCTTVGGDPGILKVFKEVETYDIVGDRPANFGEWTADEHFGCIAPRLAVTVNGIAFFWSDMGPRIASGRGTSEEIGLPLDLDGFEPDDLPTREEIERGWANYIPEARVVVFAFNRRLYCLTLRENRPAAWSYWTLGFDQMSGFQIYNTGIGAAGTSAPTTQLDWDRQGERVIGDADEYKEHKATLHWTQSGHDGDELVEIWTNKVTNWVLSWELDVDAGGSGVVDDFESAVDSGITATFTVPDVQNIEITGSTSAGEAKIRQTMDLFGDDLAEGDEVNISVECRVLSASGTFQGLVYAEFLDSGGSVIGTTSKTAFDQTDPQRRYVLDATAPANVEDIRLVLAAEAQASGDTGKVEFENALVYNKKDESGWGRVVAIPISPQGSQSYELGLQEPLDKASFYEVAFRLRRGIFVQAGGYSGSDPDTWPDVSKGLVKTAADAPYMHTEPPWQRGDIVTEGLILEFEISQEMFQRIQDHLDDNISGAFLRVLRDEGSGFNLEWTIADWDNWTLQDAQEPGNDQQVYYYRFNEAKPELPFVANNPPGEQDVEYKCNVLIGSNVTPFSNTVANWIGPPPPRPPGGEGGETLSAYSLAGNELTVEFLACTADTDSPPAAWWDEVDATLEYEVEYSVVGSGTWTAFGSSPVSKGSSIVITATETGLSADDYLVRVRTKSTVFGREDWSDWVQSNEVTVS